MKLSVYTKEQNKEIVREFGEGIAVNLATTSEVVSKRERNRAYSYAKKVGQKYVMSKDLNVKYICTILAARFAAPKPLALSLCFGDTYVTCLYNEKTLFFWIDEKITPERYLEKLGLYLRFPSYRLYTNTEIQVPGKDVEYFPFTDKMVQETAKVAIPPQQIAVLAALLVVCLFVLNLAYTAFQDRKKAALRPKPAGYNDVYNQFLSDRMAAALDVVKPVFYPQIDHAVERIVAMDKESVTVESLLYKPAYAKDGQLYKKVYPLKAFPVTDQAAALIKQVPRAESCPNTVSIRFKILDYKTEKMGTGKDAYQVREATLEAASLNYDEMVALVMDSLRHCVVIKAVRLGKEGGFTVEAAKYAKHS